MFVKKSWSINKGKKYYSYQIVESYRTEKGTRHRIIANISKLPLKVIEKITAILKYEKSKVINDKDDFFKASSIYGPIAFFMLFIKNIGALSAFNLIPIKSRKRIFSIILNRIIDPKSKLGLSSWRGIEKIFDIKNNNVNRIYEAMDVFYNKIDTVMESFYKSGSENIKFLLYDITSIYFEGKGPSFAKHGYSRDKRPDRPQILLGLCLNELGFPVYLKFFEGNIQDKKTVIELIEEIKNKYKVKNFVFIGDRGMITLDNINKLKELGLGYIMALTHRESRKLLKDIEYLEVFDNQIPIEIKRDKNEKYILCGSKYRKEHDLKLFDKILEKGKKALLEVQKMIDNGRILNIEKIIKRAQKKLTKSGADHYYDFKIKYDSIKSSLRLEIIEKKDIIETARYLNTRKLCGYYILKTTELKMKDSEVLENYKNLQTVENAFKELKHLIKIRPVFHYKDRRVITHTFLCLLAQTIVNQCRKVLKEKEWIYEKKENSFGAFLDILNQIKLGMFKFDDKVEFIVTSLSNQHEEILNMFNINKKDFLNLKLICGI